MAATAFALALSFVVLAMAYRYFSEQRFSQANHQASAVYVACEGTRSSSVCEADADAVFEAATRHRRLDAAAAAAGVLGATWLIVFCYGALFRIVARYRP